MKTDLNYIKKLIKIIDSCDINEIEIDEGDTKLRVVKSRPQQTADVPQVINYTPAAIPLMQPQPAAANETPQPKAEVKEEPKASGKNLIEVRSPIVGTFYRAPSPNADPYVQVGQSVTIGTVLCIIEAMKLMNEIECEAEGKIAKILVENAQPVEYNQVLFLIEPA
jgi:acetyl-CoA carboxylase biotin carboxyl carrier protein